MLFAYGINPFSHDTAHLLQFTFDGSDLGTVYGDFWACENATDCPCLTTAQIGIDIVTGTASQQTVAPPQLSDIIVTRLYDLETSDEALEVKDLIDPVLITITTQASDLTDFDLLVCITECSKVSEISSLFLRD